MKSPLVSRVIQVLLSALMVADPALSATPLPAARTPSGHIQTMYSVCALTAPALSFWQDLLDHFPKVWVIDQTSDLLRLHGRAPARNPIRVFDPRGMAMSTEDSSSGEVPPAPAPGPSPSSAPDYAHRKAVLRRLESCLRVLEVLAVRPEGNAIHFQHNPQSGRLTSNQYLIQLPGGGAEGEVLLREGELVGLPDSDDRYMVSKFDHSRRTAVLKATSSSTKPLPASGSLLRGGRNASTRLELETVQRLVDNLRDSHLKTTGYPFLDILFKLTPPRERPDGGTPPLDLFDVKLGNDPTQTAALNLALSGAPLVLIKGPAGTAKTSLEVEISRQWVRTGKRLYLVSQMHRGVDNAALPLSRIPGFPILRLGNTPEMFHPALRGVWPGHRSKRENGNLDPGMNGLDERVIKEFLTRADLFRGGFVWAATDIGALTDYASSHPALAARMETDADAVIMDESSRERLSGALPILMKVKAGGAAVFLGDSEQLTTHPLSREERVDLRRAGISDEAIHAYEESIFDWLLRQWNANNTAELQTNYRSPELQVRILSHLFYAGRLVAFRHDEPTVETFRLIDLSGTTGSAAREHRHEARVGTSLINIRSSRAVMALLDHYHGTLGVPLSDITVISPYLGQVELLQRLVKRRYASQLSQSAALQEDWSSQLPTISTIESFQGGQNRFVIIDMVNSNPEGRIGFNDNLRRFLVAISRSTEGMALIWDSATFTINRPGDKPETTRARDLFRAFQAAHVSEVQSLFPDQSLPARAHRERSDDFDLPDESVSPWQVHLPGWSPWRVQVTTDFVAAAKKKSADSASIVQLLEQIPLALRRVQSSASPVESVSSGPLTIYYIRSPHNSVVTLLAINGPDSTAVKQRFAQNGKSLDRAIVKNTDTVRDLFSRLHLTDVKVEEGSLLHIILREQQVFGLFETLVFRPLEGASTLQLVAQVITQNFSELHAGYQSWRFDLLLRELVTLFQNASTQPEAFYQAILGGSVLTQGEQYLAHEFATSWHQRWAKVEARIRKSIQDAFPDNGTPPDFSALQPLYYALHSAGAASLARTIARSFESWMRHYLWSFSSDDDLRALAQAEILDGYSLLRKVPAAFPMAVPFTIPGLHATLATIETAIRKRQELMPRGPAAETPDASSSSDAQSEPSGKTPASAGEAANLIDVPPATFAPDEQWAKIAFQQMFIELDLPQDSVSESILYYLFKLSKDPNWTAERATETAQRIRGMPDSIRPVLKKFMKPWHNLANPSFLYVPIMKDPDMLAELSDFGVPTKEDRAEPRFTRLLPGPVLNELASAVYYQGWATFFVAGLTYERVKLDPALGHYVHAANAQTMMNEFSSPTPIVLNRLHFFIPDYSNEEGLSELSRRMRRTLDPREFPAIIQEFYITGYISSETYDAWNTMVHSWATQDPIPWTKQWGRDYLMFSILNHFGHFLWDTLSTREKMHGAARLEFHLLFDAWRRRHTSVQSRASFRAMKDILESQGFITREEEIARYTFGELFAYMILDRSRLSARQTVLPYMDSPNEEDREWFRQFEAEIFSQGPILLSMEKGQYQEYVKQFQQPVIQSAEVLADSWPSELLERLRTFRHAYSGRATSSEKSPYSAISGKPLGSNMEIFTGRGHAKEQTVHDFLEGVRKHRTLYDVFVALTDDRHLNALPETILDPQMVRRIVFFAQDPDRVQKALDLRSGRWQEPGFTRVAKVDFSRLMFSQPFVIKLLHITNTARSLEEAHRTLREAFDVEMGDAMEGRTRLHIPASLQPYAPTLFLSFEVIPEILDAVNGLIMARLARRFGNSVSTLPKDPPWYPARNKSLTLDVPESVDLADIRDKFNLAIVMRHLKLIKNLWSSRAGHIYFRMGAFDPWSLFHTTTSRSSLNQSA